MSAKWGWGLVLVAACGSDATTNTPSGTSSSSSSSSGSTTSSSSSGDTNCADCGGCGIAGPVNVTAMQVTTVGVDSTGRAAVNVNLAKEGECRGQSQHPSTVHVTNGNAGIEVTVGAETLDRTKAATTNGSSYVWNDRDLTVEVANASSELNLTFKSAGAAVFSVKCLPVGESGSCTKE